MSQHSIDVSMRSDLTCNLTGTLAVDHIYACCPSVSAPASLFALDQLVSDVVHQV